MDISLYFRVPNVIPIQDFRNGSRSFSPKMKI